MVKKIMTMFLIIFSLMGFDTYAQENSKINFSVEKQDKNTIKIIVEAKNIKNLYSGSIKLKLDKEELEIKSITGGYDLNKENELIELECNLNKEENIAAYRFTLDEESKGLTGNIQIVELEIEVESSEEKNIIIDKNNIKINLISKSNEGSVSPLNIDVERFEENISDIKENLNKTDPSKSDSKEISKDSDKTNKDEINEINTKNVKQNKVEKSNKYIYFIIIVFITMVFIIIVYLIIKKNRKNR